MAQVTLNIPDDLLAEVLPERARSSDHLDREVLMLLAAKLYQTRQLTSAEATALAGVSRVEFNRRLGEYGVCVFDMTPEELERDIENARRYS